MASQQTYDVAIAGGGLAAGLAALCLLERHPGARIAIAEAGPRLGGNHTWCYSRSDVSDDGRAVIECLTEFSWSGYHVIFPDRRRQLATPYAGFRGERLHEIVSRRVEENGGAVLVRRRVDAVSSDSLRFADGSDLRARVVLDARNRSEVPEKATGFQNFFGLELELCEAHSLDRPILMDALVPQEGAFRFFYVLPVTATRVLVEDTRFADNPGLDHDNARQEILRYAASRGLHVRDEVRAEAGVLPMPWSAPLPATGTAPARIGAAAGWYHPATGYSLPTALRVALAIADVPLGSDPGHPLGLLAHRLAPQIRYAQWLNRLAFRWFAPEERWSCFSRFYGLPDDTIARFYRMEMTAADRARILIGRPPRGFSLRARLAS